MSKKQPNRLAKLIDHQAFAGSALPQTLADNMHLYIKTTNEVKVLLVDCLPEEILATCWVVGFTPERLVLSVTSTTAANHIRYLQNAYLQVLKKQSITFQQLKEIHVVVLSLTTKNNLSNDHSTLQHSNSNSPQANTDKALSQNTKQTIAQAAEHVTTDKNLKKALLRLIDR
ncbi:hypothetical protein [uncultured Psychrobacter sp.]|uniref:hypothetical protein n=1 Tax=uncultured Psychrobacter sp. TaxID=259303 RepID=UPI0034584E08